MAIHPLAVVESGAEIHEDVSVGPFCFVGAGAKICSGAELKNHATVYGGVTIGSGSIVYPGAVVGGDPQDLKFKGEASEVIVGERCKIHECATINKGTESGGMVTKIGDDVLIMAYAHIAHDCILGNRVIIGNNSQLAGHIKVEDRAIISGMVGVHHFASIGELAFVGAISAVRYDVPPFSTVDGHPAEPRSINLVGLRRAGFPDEEIRALKDTFRQFYNRKDNKPKAEVVAELRSTEPNPAPSVKKLIDWVDQQVSVSVKGRLQEAYR